MSSYSSTPNFDNLLLQSLMGKLQIRPQSPLQDPPFLNQTLEDLLLDTISNNLSDGDDDDDEYDERTDGGITQLAKEESKLEKEIIRTILGGKIETLKPNSGQAVTIGEENHICVGYHEESGSDYRVWEWHGHVMLFDEENGYSPEYVYGNYFERLKVKIRKEKVADNEEEKVGNSGLKELIEAVDDLGTRRILHRNLNAGSQRF